MNGHIENDSGKKPSRERSLGFFHTPSVEITRPPVLQRFDWVPVSEITSEPEISYIDDINTIQDLILANRGYVFRSQEEKNAFVTHLAKPELRSAEESGLDFLQLQKAIARLQLAAEMDEHVLLFGDTDDDGAFAVLNGLNLAKGLGIKNITWTTPDRGDHGYGFNDFFAEQYGSSNNVIVTFDCGITAKEQIAKAKAAAEANGHSCDVIVLDHHHIQEKSYPDNAYSVLYTGETSASGIAYLTVKYAEDNGYLKNEVKDTIDLMAIPLIADYEPINETNYPMIKASLAAMRNSKRETLWYLFRALDIDQQKINERDIAMTVAPTFNTPGRLGMPEKVNKYFALDTQSEDIIQKVENDFNDFTLKEREDFEKKADSMDEERSARNRPIMTPGQRALFKAAEQLNVWNNRRKDLSNTIMAQIQSEVLSSGNTRKCVIYVTDNNDWRMEVLGPLAFRLKEVPEINRPVFMGKKQVQDGRNVITYEARMPNGSADLMPLIDELNKQEWTMSAGGHTFAAGFTIREEAQKLAEDMINDYMDNNIQKIPALTKKVDCEIPLASVNNLYDFQNSIGPFGQRYGQPLFKSSQVELITVDPIGKKNKGKNHLKMRIRQNGKEISAMLFFAAKEHFSFEEQDVVDLVYTIGPNKYGPDPIQLVIEDIRTNQVAVRKPAPALQQPPELEKVEKDNIPIIIIPERLLEGFFRAASGLVISDLDDTLRFLPPKATWLRFLCAEAYFYTGNEYFRKEYAKVRHHTKDPRYLQLINRAAEVSVNYYKNKYGEEYEYGDRALFNAGDYLFAWQYEDKRAEIYSTLLEMESPKDFMNWYREKFVKGKNGFLERRIDEYHIIAAGAVELFNYYRSKGATIALNSNSSAGELMEFEDYFKRNGFASGFDQLVSGTSVLHPKPDPYSARTIIQKYAKYMELIYGKNLQWPLPVTYIGNGIGDIQISEDIFNFDKFPSDHDSSLLIPERILMTPTLVMHGQDYSEYHSLMPEHAEVDSLDSMYKEYMTKDNLVQTYAKELHRQLP